MAQQPATAAFSGTETGDDWGRKENSKEQFTAKAANSRNEAIRDTPSRLLIGDRANKRYIPAASKAQSTGAAIHDNT